MLVVNLLAVNNPHTFPNNLIPGNTIYLCENGVVIKAQNPDFEFMKLGPKGILFNASVHDAFGANGSLAMLPARNGPANGPRYVMLVVNAHDSDMHSTHWANMIAYLSGGQTGIDSPVLVLRNRGNWSGGIYTETTEKAYGIHACSYDGAIALLAQGFGTRPAVEILIEHGSKPDYGGLTVRSASDARSLHVQPGVNTLTDVSIVSGHKTHGQMLALYQANSNYHGNAIDLNLGCGSGSFDGYFVVCSKNGAPQFAITHDGDITPHGKLAQRIAALEAALLSQVDKRKRVRKKTAKRTPKAVDLSGPLQLERTSRKATPRRRRTV